MQMSEYDLVNRSIIPNKGDGGQNLWVAGGEDAGEYWRREGVDGHTYLNSEMSKICISNCVNDARIPVRATYVNLYKWPESDAEFVKSVGANDVHGGSRLRSRVVDSISCRQLYLRSYTFSRKETVPERTKKCFGRVKERVSGRGKKRKVRPRRRRRNRRRLVVRKVKELSCAALCAIFRRLQSCTATVDVVDHNV
ncbi:Hypothetical predicted protein [Olea europaea subsp. europaea]|uniref:Uncharacterized protein n=1 Tax=Olea europaea subsp. europaea TaxID=158383 RepID=A0A8S0UGH2_OLEEU|nr:Hypothetical predicted protein [Olea europaea subsp. europaea]